MRVKRAGKRASATTSWLMRIAPSRFTLTTSGCDGSIASAGRSSGSFGMCSQICLESAGVITMKMIKSTSTTSTSGVTFISGV